MSRLRTKSKRYRPARMQLTKEKVNGEDKPVLYVEVNLGKEFMPIAKRYPGQNWINLEPGWKVTGSEPGDDPNVIRIYHDGGVAAAMPH